MSGCLANLFKLSSTLQQCRHSACSTDLPKPIAVAAALFIRRGSVLENRGKLDSDFVQILLTARWAISDLAADQEARLSVKVTHA